MGCYSGNDFLGKRDNIFSTMSKRTINKHKKYFVFKNELGERYYGINSVIKKFKDEQDWDEICRKTAEKRGVDPIELKKEWDLSAERSKKRGILYHKKMEEKYLKMNKPNIFITSELQLKWDSQELNENCVYIEKLIWDDDFKIIGYPDYVQTVKNVINIIDYKTNSEIKYENKWQSYNDPISYLDDCNFSDYALQINGYMFMMLKNNPSFKIGQMIIEWVRFNDDNTIDSIEKIPVPNLQKEINLILTEHERLNNN